MNRAQERGLVLLGAALLLLGVTFGGSAAVSTTAEVRSDNASETLVGIQGGGVGLHEDGRVAMFDESGTRTWAIQNADSYFDVTQQDDGTILAGFMHSGYENCGPYDAPCSRTGFRVLDPDADDPVVFEYTYPVRTKKNSETHDVEKLPNGRYLVSGMDEERIFVVDANGTVTWQWNAADYYESPPDPTKTDWLHLNDVDRIGDGRYLVSIRNANQLVVVERGEGVVEVINEDDDATEESECTMGGRLNDANGDGDVNCGDPDVMDEQHNPQWLSEDAVLVADSGNDRVVELHRNATTGEWEVAWAISEANGVEFAWPRDADRLPNGNTLITDSANARVVEVTQDGETVWSASMANNHFPYEAERLPDGETVGGPVYENGTVQTETTDRVPGLTPALAMLRTSMPLPVWLSELHLGVGLVSLGLSVAGIRSLLLGRGP
ncbi:aryl-sulfate sulfotransferase [Haloarculaceae archaeon H-GB2-1]|nr:arylsulfotransferase family protein [Haloarculaceae archaeon H-GB1-1]MEA5409219.1 aryl-sulfate sulfotransferase [Haloarculaceae archaeon H-GB2-1]